MPYFMEVIFIQLPHKTCEVAVLEVLGEDMLGEFLILHKGQKRYLVYQRLFKLRTYLKNDEAVALVSPPHNTFV
jgi:hypothetical protein